MTAPCTHLHRRFSERRGRDIPASLLRSAVLEHWSTVDQMAVLPGQAVRRWISDFPGIAGKFTCRLLAAGTWLPLWPWEIPTSTAGHGSSFADGWVPGWVSRWVVHRVAGARVAIVVEVNVVVCGGAGDHGRSNAFPRFTSGIPVAPSDGSKLLIRHVLTPPLPDPLLTCNSEREWEEKNMTTNSNTLFILYFEKYSCKIHQHVLRSYTSP